jgi:alkanesulfonate monooxygenase SsuD/methylene tetrahydromethanopterin reductase-like flavin-dependent oxidoreductase (luciferase family)
VKVGFFFDLRNPPDWRRPWDRHYAQTLEWIAGADRLGADAVWFTEHHLFEDGYLPQPLTFAAAAAARTERVRIGAGIVIAPLRHPAHVAEEAALVDLISGGRLELGLGAGWSTREYELFDVDFTLRFAMTDAAAAQIRLLLDERVVMPPPLQRPFPIWLGYQGPRGARRAGQLGVGLLSLDRTLLEPYLGGLEEGGHGAASARMGGLLDIVVADDPEDAAARIEPFSAYQLSSYRRAKALSRGDDPGDDLSLETLRTSGRLTAVLSPEDAVAAIRERTAGLPVEHVYLWASISGMPDDLVERHLELTIGRVRAALATDDGGPA